MSLNNYFVSSIIDQNNFEKCVEVGVWRGDLSFFILDNCPSIKEYYMIDPLRTDDNDFSYFGDDCPSFMPDGRYECDMGEGLKTQEEFDQIYVNILNKIGHDNRVKFIRNPSLNAVDFFDDDSLDFVFIDAVHLYENVKQDVIAWIKKVKPGGIISGDDHTNYFPGIPKALYELFGNNYTVDDCIWSFKKNLNSNLKLKDIHLNYITDKGTGHNYLETYENLFSEIRENKLNVLEIGVLLGGSLKMWEQYFSNSIIYGIDDFSQLDTNSDFGGIEVNPENIRNDLHQHERIKFIELNSRDYRQVKNKIESLNIKFDIIIDDADHLFATQIDNFNNFVGYLNSGAIYIIEDCESLECANQIKEYISIMYSDYDVDIIALDTSRRHDDILMIIKSKSTVVSNSENIIPNEINRSGNLIKKLNEIDTEVFGLSAINNQPIEIIQILNKFDINGFDNMCGTDKNTAHSYAEIFQELLEPFIEKGGSLLEIGVRFGGSLILWNEFLPKFKIFGLEVEDNLTQNMREYLLIHPDKIFLEFKDAYLQETVDYMKSLNPDGFDVIIDDGPHTEESQIKCIQLYLDLLKNDGLLLIEDILDFGTVEVLRDSIPKSDLYDYEVTVYDHREKKGMFDDVIFAIRKKKKQLKNKLAIFYHLYQTNNYDWIKLYQQQINSLIVSGVYDECDFIHIGINGDQELPFVLDKMKVQYNENKILEANTLQSLWEFCKNNLDYKVLYFHSKGVTHKDNDICEVTTNAWRIYLEYFVIHNWKTCIGDLNSYDCVGPEWIFKAKLPDPNTGEFVFNPNPHYAGNFWWANAAYIQNLDIDYLYNKTTEWERYRSEFWIGTKNPNYKSYHNSNKLLYEFHYSPNYYTKTESISMKNKVFIITPCTRPLNLSKISQSIPEECEWVVVLDSRVKNVHYIDNATIIKSPSTGFRGYSNKNYGLDYIANNLNPADNDWVIILHDDNIIHPNWWNTVKDYLNLYYSMLTWGQCTKEELPRISSVEIPKIGNIDTSQYMVKWEIAKNLRFKTSYEADGIYAEEAANQGSVLKLDQYLGYYNFLRSHKTGMNSIRSNICMISMFKNESKGIRRMLESVWRHIDFYVFQDNGSTDGTPDIVREFFADKNIPGFIYEVEEGWVGFGWNRDHLLQTALRNDHGCDWIMKMDCDEYLEVDDDFDWSPFYTSDKQAFHVPSVAPGCIYLRSWIWNAKFPWKFKHDLAHECIYLDDGVTGENFSAETLSRSFRMVGTSDGESYTVRTKYISDALKLEEKLIREETMLTDLYHFWYTAKSYHDCFAGDFYPFGELHSNEFARRAIFYYQQYIDYMKAGSIHEMTYFSMFSIGDLYKYLGDTEKAIQYYKDAEKYCPQRNEHIVCLAFTYNELKEYDKMLEQTTRLMEPERKLPFPDYCFLLNSNIYYDSGTVPQQLHDIALSSIASSGKEYATPTINDLKVSSNTKPRLWIVDNFYENPDEVRKFALEQKFEENIDYYKGNRTQNQYIIPGTKEAFEKIIGKKITNWTETHGMCGRFQYCTAQDDLVYHCDAQTLAGMIYLTPDAPPSCGTSLFAHKRTGLRNENDFGNVNVFDETGFYDRSKFELVDTAGNVFNRLVLFDAKSIHAANEYFGTTKENSRLFHLFFFD